MIVVSDANILMDLGVIGGLDLLTALGPTEVLSTILLECAHEKQPTLLDDVRRAGILTIDVEKPLLLAAAAYDNQILSLKDKQALLYARETARILLTGETSLRLAAEQEQVRAHDAAWLVEQAFHRQVVPAQDLCRWLNAWPLRQRRLPKKELNRLRLMLGCGTSGKSVHLPQQ